MGISIRTNYFERNKIVVIMMLMIAMMSFSQSVSSQTVLLRTTLAWMTYLGYFVVIG